MNENDPTAGLTRKQIRELRSSGDGQDDAPTTALPIADDAPTPAMGVPAQASGPAVPPQGPPASHSGSGSDGDQPKKRWTKRHTKRTIVIAIIVLVLCGLWLGIRALMVKGDLEAAQRIVTHVQEEPDSLRGAMPVLGDYAGSAASVRWDPVWRVAEIIPWAGANLKGVRLASESLDVAVNDLAVPAFDAMDSGGDESVLQKILPVLEDAQPRVEKLAEGLDGVAQSGSLIGPVRSGVDLVNGIMQSAAPAIGVAPGLLGAEGEKNYLLVFMNNAESVGLAGSAASQTLVHVDNGNLEITAQAGSGEFNEEGGPVDVEVPQSALDLYSSFLVDHVNTTPSRPDFPTMASLNKAFWNRDIGDQQIDGVVALDPIALSYILDATGPITITSPDGTVDTLTSDNAVQLLLSEVYARWNSYEAPELVDAFFAGVAAQVFDKIATADFNMMGMVSSLGRGIDQGSILFHSFDDETQDFIADERVSGILPTDNEETSTVGVYFRDESASKIDYYMRSNIDVTQTCTDGSTSFDVATTLHLDIDQGVADALPDYVKSGTPGWGSSRFRTAVYVYGPPGTTLDEVTVEGREVEIKSQDIDDLGRPVAFVWTYLAPTELATVNATFSGDGDFGPAALWSTPMVNATTGTVAACGE
ncbi:MAG: DUF4012 domain-containing protein [Microbacterium gubbeenense]|uniref:DUF4012 domain-containing protein n=4 Tax=Microbacterium gubbeenense TaxID=159896 RepID=UPI00146CF9FE|nr:DUF4012 domain-containing protein [Microbacterium gubbeenense]